MKIAFLSKYGDAADIALRMFLGGDDVRLYIDEPGYRENFRGLVPKVKTWQEAVDGADLAVFDDNKLSHVWKAIHRKVPCFGGSEFAARLENARSYSRSLAQRLKLDQPEHYRFKTAAEVLAHLKSKPGKWVIKPEGPKVESHHTMLGTHEDSSDAIALVERFAGLGVPTQDFQVEEYVDGLEAAVSIWVCDGERVGPYNVNFEHKHLCHGNLGPLCGEAGTPMRYVDEHLPFFQETIDRYLPVLKAAGYRGQLDLNFKVTPDGKRKLLEPTPRLGKPSVFIEDEGHLTPWARLFHGLATGQDPKLEVRYDWLVGVVLFAFGFPFEKETPGVSKGLPVHGLEKDKLGPKTLEHLHPMQCTRDAKGNLVVGHGEGYVLVATGRDESLYGANRAALRALDDVEVKNSFHRRDIGQDLDLYQVEQLGLLPKGGWTGAVATPH